MLREGTRQLFCYITLIIALVVNALATLLPLGGIDTGELARSFDVLFLPAGYVFSIWGLIYIAVLAFTIFQGLGRHKFDRELDKIGTAFCWTNIANALWLIFFHYELIVLSLVPMLALLGLLIYITVRLNVGRERAPIPRLWFVHLPFGIYLGWISVATVANVTQVLSIAGLSGVLFGDVGWTIVTFVAVLALSLFMSFRLSNIPHAAVVVWALIGIAVEQSEVEVVAVAAIVTAVLVVLGLIAALFLKREHPDVVV